MYGVRVRRTNIYLSDEQLDALRRVGAQRNVPVAELVREAVDEWLRTRRVRPIPKDEWDRRFDTLLRRRDAIAKELERGEEEPGEQEPELDVDDLTVDVTHEAEVDRLQRGQEERVLEVELGVRSAREDCGIEPVEQDDRARLHRPHRPVVPLVQRPHEAAEEEHGEVPGEEERDPAREPAGRGGAREGAREMTA